MDNIFLIVSIFFVIAFILPIYAFVLSAFSYAGKVYAVQFILLKRKKGKGGC